MSPLRPIVVLALAAACGKAEPDPCFEPRDLSYQGECAVLEQTWAISKDALPDFQPYCSAPCIDVDAGVSVAGYEELSEVPLLRKFRRVRALGVDAHSFRDLRGLETVEVASLGLRGTGVDDAFESMVGLNVRSIASLNMTDISGRDFLGGSKLEYIGSASIEATGILSADMSALTFGSLRFEANREFSRLTLPNNVMDSLTLSDNPKLAELGWDAGIRVWNLRIVSNDSLSSCIIDDFVRTAKPDGGPPPRIFDNGPCP